MKIYSVQTNGDGLLYEVATNVKMLFNMINKIITSPFLYIPITIEYYDRVDSKTKSIKFNYNNLQKAIKESSNKNQYWAHVDIICEYDAFLKVRELGIFDK